RPPLWKSFAPFDAVALSFLSALLAINLLSRHAIPGWPLLTMEYGLLIILIPSLIHMAQTRAQRGWKLARNFYLIPLTMLSFDSLGEMVPYVNPHSYDADLATWDAAVFGVHPTIWLQRIVTPWLTEIMQIAYASYYFLPIILMVRLSQTHRKQQAVFVEAATTLGLTFFLSYVGYFLLPVSGPRHYLAPLYTVPLTGVLLAGPIANTINALENIKWDCFPSGHTAVVLVVLSYVWRHARPLLRYYLPVSVLLILATVYCRYHYVLDVLAGAALAGLCLWLGPRLCRAWTRLVAIRCLSSPSRRPSSRSPAAWPPGRNDPIGFLAPVQNGEAVFLSHDDHRSTS
ncbi:MAG: phosphatase PAP2 family protein, partial [bacterium]